MSFEYDIFAHEFYLNVTYDSCIVSTSWNGSYNQAILEDGSEEMWYCTSNVGEKHISEQVTVIKYYFADNVIGSKYTWNADVIPILNM